MASKSDRKFLTTLSFARQIGEAIFKSYENEVRGDLIKKRSLELMNLSDKYLSKFAPGAKMTDKNLAEVARVVNEMMKNGLEDTKSFQTYLSMVIGMLSERESELMDCKGIRSDLIGVLCEDEEAFVSRQGRGSKVDCVVELQEIANKCWVYFASRTRKDEFDVLGCDLLNVFNAEFS